MLREMTQWMKIPCLSTQLQLKTTLTGGQSFRWKTHDTAKDEFIGVFSNIVWILKQSATELLFKIVGELPYPNESNMDVVPSVKKAKKQRTSTAKTNLAEIRLKVPEPEQYSSGGNLLYPESYYQSLLRVYFRLDVDLDQCYQQWNKCHTHFENSAGQFYAVRQLDQDPVENLFSFICSQNNNISRISGLVESICTHYGEKICDYNGQPFYNFPNVNALAPAEVDGHLRELSFGYRAKYIQKAAEEILAKGDLEWFRKLRQLDYKEAHSELLTLTGIGPKVADCICLMSLNHLQAIPVDTHVFQIARHYLPHLAKCKAVSRKIYGEIGDKFREIYGAKAGWAQTVLFCADLRQFKEGSVEVAEDADEIGASKNSLPSPIQVIESQPSTRGTTRNEECYEPKFEPQPSTSRATPEVRLQCDESFRAFVWLSGDSNKVSTPKGASQEPILEGQNQPNPPVHSGRDAPYVRNTNTKTMQREWAGEIRELKKRKLELQVKILELKAKKLERKVAARDSD